MRCMMHVHDVSTVMNDVDDVGEGWEKCERKQKISSTLLQVNSSQPVIFIVVAFLIIITN